MKRERLLIALADPGDRLENDKPISFTNIWEMKSSSALVSINALASLQPSSV